MVATQICIFYENAKNADYPEKILRSVGPMNGIYQKLLKFHLPNRSPGMSIRFKTWTKLKLLHPTRKLLLPTQTATSNSFSWLTKTSNCYIQLKLLHPTSKTATSNSNCYIQLPSPDLPNLKNTFKNTSKQLLTKTSKNVKKALKKGIKKQQNSKVQKVKNHWGKCFNIRLS